MAAFLSDEQIKPRQIVNSPLATIGLNATPTLLIVDQSGTIRHAFIDQLDEQRERNLMTLLGVVASNHFDSPQSAVAELRWPYVPVIYH